jgi:endonuclease/exonuclease/phosphatase family metal-dependent hydrolase
MNVHLDHYGHQSRIESSRVIVCQAEQLRKQNYLPVIVAGDFNARAWTPYDEDVSKYPQPVLPQYLPVGNEVHQVFMEHNYKDIYLEAGNKDQLAMNTYHDYYGDTFPPVALRIDWILALDGYQGVKAVKYTLIRDAVPPIYASDHYPIMAELAWS